MSCTFSVRSSILHVVLSFLTRNGLPHSRRFFSWYNHPCRVRLLPGLQDVVLLCVIVPLSLVQVIVPDTADNDVFRPTKVPGNQNHRPGRHAIWTIHTRSRMPIHRQKNSTDDMGYSTERL